ncbi:MAG TPA: putative 2OG-Fe(II) oxygenase [Caulobacter sp.]|nr:putative 2OG-Fe(II) oxygenase [Caulobacter sp.]
MTPDQVRLLNTVEHHLEGGRPDEAQKVLDRVAREIPDAPRVWWARATLAQMRGDSAGAESALRRTAALDPAAPYALTALGELLYDQDRGEEAKAAWREAHERDPRFLPATMSLAEYLVSTGDPAGAVAVLDRGLAGGRDPGLSTLRAQAQMERGETQAALADYREAVAASNGSPQALHNLALALIIAGEAADGEAVARQALALQPTTASLWQVLGQALLARDALSEAQDAFETGLKHDPQHPGCHRDLSQLIWMRTGEVSAALARVDAALEEAKGFSPLTVVKGKLLEYVGDLDGARQVLATAANLPGAPNYLLCAASQVLLGSDRLQAATLAAQAVGRAPRDTFGLATLAQAQLAAGDIDGAELTAGRIRRLAPLDQHGLALQATAWRLKDDPRYRALYDYDALVRTSVIDTPEGWSDLDGYLADLEKALAKLHGHEAHPIGQSLRGGTQTNVRLEKSDDPAIRAFFQAIDAPIRAYIAGLGEGDDPVRGRITGGYKLAGSWSIRLRPGGHHVDHLHHKGWISSAFYVALPASVRGEGDQGSLRFGQPGTPTRPPVEAEFRVKPRPGLLALFPAYMWHGTDPFEGEDARLTIAFDVVPA